MGQAGSVGHRDTVYTARNARALTWFEAAPQKSLHLIAAFAPETLAGRIEVLAPGAMRPVQAERHVHVTPKGNRQALQTTVFRRL